MEVRQEPKAQSPSAGSVASPGTRPQQAPPATTTLRSARWITPPRQTKERHEQRRSRPRTAPADFPKPLGSSFDNLPTLWSLPVSHSKAPLKLSKQGVKQALPALL